MGNGQSVSIRDCLDAWAKPFNLEFPVIPAAIIRPQNVIEVSETVKCAKQSGLKVQAKSGGHSYGNYGLGGDNDALSIDLVNLKDFEMDNETWYASFGAGTNLGELDKNLHTFGRRAIAHGTCPSVGTGGHLTVVCILEHTSDHHQQFKGGLGPISRMWGSALDHVVEMEVVAADGTIYLASEGRTPDLFWAMRGAGASFGIVTRFVVKTRPEPGNVVQYSYSLTLNSQNGTADLYKEWQALVGDPTMDRRFASLFIVQPLGALITGTFFGSETEYQASGIPARLPGASKGAVWLTNWMGHLLHESEAAGCTLGSIPTAFYSKSLSLNEQDLLNDTAVTDLFQYLEDSRSKSTPFTIIFNTEGGAMMDTPINATAYPHRESVIMYQSYGIGVGKVSAATRKLLDGIHERIQRSAPGARSTYAGYVDAWLDRKAAQELYWADNLPRLQDIKKKWDPDQVFRNPQSVEPAD